MARVRCRYCTQGVPHELMDTHVRLNHPEIVTVPTMLEAPSPITQPFIHEDNTDTYGVANGSFPPELTPVAVVTEAEPLPLEDEAAFEFSVPKVDPFFKVQDDMIEFFKLIEVLAKDKPRKIKLTGPQGAGKTSLAQQFAAIYNRPLYIVPCVTMQEQAQWFGLWQANTSRGTFYIPARFVRAIETLRCVIIFDDMNRVENPKVLNPLLPLLDDQREVYSDDLRRTIRVANEVIFFGTCNEGYQYQGTDPIDAALNDRFFPVPVKYPSDQIIRQILTDKTKCDYNSAKLISDFATALASHERDPIFMSMRRAIMIGELVRAGASVRNAVKFAFQADLPVESMEHALATMQMLLQDDYTASEPKWESWVS